MSEYSSPADTVPSPAPIKIHDTADHERTIALAICTDGVKPAAPFAWLLIVADKDTGEIRCAISRTVPQ